MSSTCSWFLFIAAVYLVLESHFISLVVPDESFLLGSCCLSINGLLLSIITTPLSPLTIPPVAPPSSAVGVFLFRARPC